MPVDLRIVGAEQLADVARRCKEAGDKELRRDLMRGINRSLKPAKAAVKAAALRELPRRGGLNRVIATSRIGSRSRTGGRNPAVFLTGKKAGHDLRSVDRGRLRHPVFGNKSVWVTQEIKPGWWSRTLQDQAPRVRREVVDVLEDVARRLARG